MATILVVEDDPGFRSLLRAILSGEGYDVFEASTVREAREQSRARKFDLLIADLKLPDGDGLQVLGWYREHSPETVAIVLTAFGTVPSAVEAMKLGAFDYLEKPLRSPDELRLLVARALESNRLRRERDLLWEQEQQRFQCDSIIAEDPAMKQTLELVRKVAPTDATVLLMGESGTGKELLARCIHAHSPRRHRVFVAVNCAALPPTLIESELFGHEKGAFTGAVTQHPGRFERADGGTLFLDEVAELDPAAQAKLLRVLQEKTFERVGGRREIRVDVRVIAATNRDLPRMVEEGRFREDLYYRLSVFPITVPPLRARPADIPALAEFLLARAARRLGKTGLVLTPEAQARLMNYSWPGNVRELENLMERVAILCDGEVRAEDLPIATAQAQARPLSWKEIERRAIEEALKRNHGNRTRAARELGISVRKLQYRLKEYGYRD